MDYLQLMLVNNKGQIAADLTQDEILLLKDLMSRVNTGEFDA